MHCVITDWWHSRQAKPINSAYQNVKIENRPLIYYNMYNRILGNKATCLGLNPKKLKTDRQTHTSILFKGMTYRWVRHTSPMPLCSMFNMIAIEVYNQFPTVIHAPKTHITIHITLHVVLYYDRLRTLWTSRTNLPSLPLHCSRITRFCLLIV